ncbi:LexA family protein [Limosilactobacillus vaginalis]|uniref:LexA family protein n=1 Tax=Limosilactobacillus vaginalis TaxID=1633 RepID=UPI003AAD822D
MRSSSEVVDYLDNLRKKQQVSISELARRVSMSKSTVSLYFKKEREFPVNRLDDFAMALHTTPEDVLGVIDNSNVKNPSNVIYPLSDSLQRVKIPIIGEIACGDPITAEENIEGYTEETFEKPIPSGTLFALRCKGHSMEPTIHDGSLVTIREQPTVEDGEIAAVLVDGDNEATLKRVKHQGDLIMLMPDNKEYDPIILDKNNPGRIVGKAVHVSWNIK